MKLLEKKTIVTLKGNERKKEIEEAVKLAKKVDLLRETAAKEEANLAKFRNETLFEVKNEIKVLIEEKNALQSQIIALQEERTRLLIPLDKEWKKVEKEKTEIEERSTLITREIKFISSQKEELQERIDKLILEEERIKDIKNQEVNKLSEIDQYNKEADQLLIDTKIQTGLVLDKLLQRERIILAKEKDVEYKLRDIENTKKILNDREKEIQIEKRQLADQRSTLERAFNRLKK